MSIPLLCTSTLGLSGDLPSAAELPQGNPETLPIGGTNLYLSADHSVFAHPLKRILLWNVKIKGLNGDLLSPTPHGQSGSGAWLDLVKACINPGGCYPGPAQPPTTVSTSCAGVGHLDAHHGADLMPQGQHMLPSWSFRGIEGVSSPNAGSGRFTRAEICEMQHRLPVRLSTSVIRTPLWRLLVACPLTAGYDVDSFLLEKLNTPRPAFRYVVCVPGWRDGTCGVPESITGWRSKAVAFFGSRTTCRRPLPSQGIPEIQCRQL
jgi:hypothetical protein